MNNTNKEIKTSKILSLILKTLCTNLFCYVYGVIVPCVIAVAALFYYTMYSPLGVKPGTVLACILYIPISTCFISQVFIGNGRHSNIFKYLHLHNVKRIRFNLIYGLSMLIYINLSVLVDTFFIMMVALIKGGVGDLNPLIVAFEYLSYGSAWQIIMGGTGGILSIYMMGLSSMSLGFIIGIFIKHKTLAQSLNLLVFVCILFLSELLLTPAEGSTSGLTKLAYICPQKYATWACYLSVANNNALLFIKPLYISASYFLSFTSLGQPLLGGFGYLGVLFLSCFYVYNTNNRGVQ